MKKIHIHVGVNDLKPAIRFYSTMFGVGPIKVKSDYAKWEPEDTPVVFAISTRTKSIGLDHLGIKIDSGDELKDISSRLKNADLGVYGEGEVACCYAKSNKAWVKDPAGIAWETYQNMEDVEFFKETPSEGEVSACCSPQEVGEEQKKKGACC